MTDKIQKIREEISKMQDATMDKNGNFLSGYEQGVYDALCEIDTHLQNLFIDSLQEPINTDLLSKVDKQAKRIWEEINTGHEYAVIDSYNQFYGICVEIAECLQEEPVNSLDNGNMPIERWKQAVKAASHQRSYRSSKGLTETKDDYFVDGVQWADEHPKEEPVSEDLEEAAIQFATDTETGKVDVVKQGSFFWGAQWKERQFEKNRLKHCNSITNEQAELEQGFIDQHLDKYQRMPTFLDAIEYGIRLQKEQMMKDAVVTTVVESYGSEKVNNEWRNVVTPKIEIYDNSLVLGDKVKVVVIKGD